MHRFLHRLPLARCLVCAAAAVLGVIHPLVHGTPLDGGVLDGIMVQLDMLAMTWGAQR